MVTVGLMTESILIRFNINQRDVCKIKLKN